MSQILRWPCKRCGVELNDIDHYVQRKYCDMCKIIVHKERVNECNRNRKRPRKATIQDKVLYLLKQNGMVTKGELLSFSGANWSSVRTILSTLRGMDHSIKFSGGFYSYGGQS